MLPGFPCRLTCPHCGAYKYIESIASGNTFWAVIWSDSKRDYPMLPTPSPVQRCPHCGGYFFHDDGKPSFKEEGALGGAFSGIFGKGGRPRSRREIQQEAEENGFGHLTEKESAEAYAALYSDKLKEGKKVSLLQVRLFAFNNEYLRNEDTLPDELLPVQREFVEKLQKICKKRTIFVAELYREMGDFEKAVGMLSSYAGGEDAEVARMILERARAKDRTVFPVICDR